MLGIIGGSGLYDIPWLKNIESLEVFTRYGSPSSHLLVGDLDGSATTQRICFLARHGEQHNIPPHKVNYRANVQAMVDSGVTSVVSVNAVGACDAAIKPGSLVLPDQIIDYTWGREHTFFDELTGFASHVDFTAPFCKNLRKQILAAASKANVAILKGGTYGCTQGPRLETAAEIRRLTNDGCDLVGMTLMPEAALCKERQLACASICVVANTAAGVQTEFIDVDEVAFILKASVAQVQNLLRQLPKLTP